MEKSLPISSVERLHLLDDQLAWPNWIGSHLYLEGALDPAIVNASVEIMEERHPMITAYAPGAPRRPRRWILGDKSRVLHPRFFTGEIPPPIPDRPNIASEKGVLFVGWTNGQRSRVSFLSHHAIADGLGGLLLMREWLKIYDNIFHGREPGEGLERSKTELLKKRNSLGLWTRAWISQLWKQPVALFGAWKFLFRSFCCLALPPPGTEATSPADWPRILNLSIDRRSLNEVRKKALVAGVSLNDWLAAALFEAIQEWRNERGEADDSWIRMIIPMNLRNSTDWIMPAANRTTLVQIDRRKQDLHPRIRLMQGIAFELGVIRKWQLDRMFLIVLRITGVSQSLLAWLAKWNKPRATTLLTNLGKPLLFNNLAIDEEQKVQVGNMRLTRMELIPPIRFGMPASFAVHQYRRELHVSVHYDAASLDQNSVQRLMDIFAARIVALELD